MNYIQLSQAIQDYSENTESLFVANIPRFIQESETRIYNTVQLPSLRKNVTGTLTSGNKYLSLPTDWLATYSIAVIDASGNYNFLLNKDVNFLREAYPNPTTTTALPKYYAIFGPNTSDLNELSAILAPTPDSSYSVELHYYYYPISIVQGAITVLNAPTSGSGYVDGMYANIPFNYVDTSVATGSGSGLTGTLVISGGAVTSITIDTGGSLYAVGDNLTVDSSYIGTAGSGFAVTVNAINNTTGTSWLGDNYDPVLFYGAMREAMIFMKGEQDMVQYYETKYQEALQQLARLGAGLERGDAYRDGQAKIKVTL